MFRKTNKNWNSSELHSSTFMSNNSANAPLSACIIIFIIIFILVGFYPYLDN